MLVQARLRLIKKEFQLYPSPVNVHLDILDAIMQPTQQNEFSVQISYAERTQLSDITVIHPNSESNQHRDAAAAFIEKEKKSKIWEAV